jgi:hypothetical protein
VRVNAHIFAINDAQQIASRNSDVVRIQEELNLIVGTCTCTCMIERGFSVHTHSNEHFLPRSSPNVIA